MKRSAKAAESERELFTKNRIREIFLGGKLNSLDIKNLAKLSSATLNIKNAARLSSAALNMNPTGRKEAQPEESNRKLQGAVARLSEKKTRKTRNDTHGRVEKEKQKRNEFKKRQISSVDRWNEKQANPLVEQRRS